MTEQDQGRRPVTDETTRDTYSDRGARLAAANIGWSREHGDPPADPDYIKHLAFQVMAFQPPLVAGVYVDDATLNRMRDRLHGDRCGCGEWDSHSGEYIDQMDATIHAVLYPLRHAGRPVSQGTEDDLPDGLSPRDFAIAGGALMRDAQEAILADMLGGLDLTGEWPRMARNAAKAAVKIAVQRGWRPTQ